MATDETDQDKKKQARARQQRLPLDWDDSGNEKTEDAGEKHAEPADEEGSERKPDDAKPAPQEDRQKGNAASTAADGAENDVEQPAGTSPETAPDKETESGTRRKGDAPAAASSSKKPKQAGRKDKGKGTRKSGMGAKRSEADGDVVHLGQIETTFGQTLLEARGACNLSIAQVSQKTKIPPRFIQAVEADKHDQLPSPIYSRSYIKQLCRTYGIPSEKILEDYDQKCGRTAETPQPAPPSRPPQGGHDADTAIYPRIKREVAPGKLLQNVSRYAVMIALGVLVLLVLIAFAVQQVHNYRMRQAQEKLPSDPAAERAEIELEEFIVPQTLPLKELPIPEQ